MPAPDPLHSIQPDWLWEASPDGMVLVDAAGVIETASAEAHRVFGYPDGGLVGRNVDELVPPELADLHKEHRRGFTDAPSRRPMGAGRRLMARRADGTDLPVHIALAPVDDGYTLAAVRDMSGYALTEERLVAATRRRLLAEDRERIARDLHDTVIQELFALGMTLQSTVATTTDDALAQRLDSAVGALDSVIHSIRALIFDIGHVSGTTGEGLRAEVVEVAAGFTPSLGFEPTVTFRGPIDTAVPQSHREHVIAVVREGLANVARHADASSASVTLVVAEGDVTVRVHDDGRGIPTEATRRSGLANLATRAVDVGGRFVVEGDPGGGTVLRWTAPLEDNPGPEKISE